MRFFRGNNSIKKHNMGVNAVLNGIRSGLSILFPLITYPYAFRVLKVEGIGKVNYSLSIVNFFILFAGLGISTYAVREGAKVKNDRKEIEKFSSEIFSINIFSMFFSYFSLALCMICINKFRLYTELIIIQSISIFFVTIGFEWINSIYEDYVYIVIRCFNVPYWNFTSKF